jgi:molybdenum-dependent DNA-binding transcriptional regulator ModE
MMHLGQRVRVDWQNEYQRSINGTKAGTKAETKDHPMQDLNDYALFAEVILNGGFAAAGRALGMPKSTLSRRIAALETRLGVRLIERSTRRFRVTEVGQAFYERCRTIVLDVQQADSRSCPMRWASRTAWCAAVARSA